MQPTLKGAAAMFFQHPRPVSAVIFCNWRVKKGRSEGLLILLSPEKGQDGHFKPLFSRDC